MVVYRITEADGQHETRRLIGKSVKSDPAQLTTGRHKKSGSDLYSNV